jgi:hypothetical protein
MTTCTERSRIDAHFEGEISPDAERAMRMHLPTCAACQARYERWLVLSRLDPAIPSAKARLARGLGLEDRRSVVHRFGVTAATILAAAAVLLLWLHPGAQSPGFAARGGVARAASSRVFVYDVHPGKPPVLAPDSVTRGDELAFAYENGAAKSHLMIFGVDEHHHVYWFFPAWVSESDNPIAIPIEHDDQRHELPEAVRHDFDGSHLEIRSLFLDAPVNVSQVEAMLREHPVGPLPIPGAVEMPASFVVVP